MVLVTTPEEAERVNTHYDLLANICHEGKPEAGEGTYKVHVRQRGTEQWYQIQDLIVEEILPQMIFLSESYIQVKEKEKNWHSCSSRLTGFMI